MIKDERTVPLDPIQDQMIKKVLNQVNKVQAELNELRRRVGDLERVL